MSNPQLSIIMVSYNTADYTCRALDSIYAQTSQTSFEIIIVDNNSQDDSVAQIRAQFPQIHLIVSQENLGFAGGVALGAAQAKGQYLLLLNPDTLILEGAIDKLLQFAENHPNNGIWSGVTLNNDLSLNSQHAWSRPSFRSLLFSALGLSKLFKDSCFFNYANYGCWQRHSVKAVDIVSGCFFLTKAAIWKELKGLDTKFFMYAEEADFCLRAIKKGYRPIVTPEARIIHHGGVSHTHFSGKLIKLLTGKVGLIKRHEASWKHPLYKGLLLLYVVNKYYLHLLFKPSSEDTKEWHTVLKQRRQWLEGY